MSNALPLSPDELRALLARSEEGELSSEESARLEATLASDPDLIESVLEPLPGEGHLLDEPVEPPTEFEWARVDRGLEAAIAGGGSAPAGETDQAGDAPPNNWIFPLGSVAAAAILCAVILRMIISDGLGDPDAPPLAADLETPMAEVLDLQEDEETMIMFPPEDEGGGVIIFMTNS